MCPKPWQLKHRAGLTGQGRISSSTQVPATRTLLGTGPEVRIVILTILGKPGGGEREGVTLSRFVIRRSGECDAGLNTRQFLSSIKFWLSGIPAIRPVTVLMFDGDKALTATLPK